jgi:hypothetical protein
LGDAGDFARLDPGDRMKVQTPILASAALCRGALA